MILITVYVLLFSGSSPWLNSSAHPCAYLELSCGWAEIPWVRHQNARGMNPCCRGEIQPELISPLLCLFQMGSGHPHFFVLILIYTALTSNFQRGH